MVRSPYLEAKVNRWSKEKRELVIENCDITSFNIIVDFMYGIEIPESVVVKVGSADEEKGSASKTKTRKVDLLQDEEKLGKLLEMSERLLMADLKVEVEALLVKNINISNLFTFARLAENFNCKNLIEVGAKLMVKEGHVSQAVDKGMTEVMPKFSAALLIAFSEERKVVRDGFAECLDEMIKDAIDLSRRTDAGVEVPPLQQQMVRNVALKMCRTHGKWMNKLM